jgi:4-carboxymuconolactone decarboxylase
VSAERRRFGPLPVEEMTDEQRGVADAILSGARGSGQGLRGPFEAMLRSPGLADPAQRVGEHVRFRSSIPAHLNEMAIIMTARRWTAQYEWYAHRRMALAAGLEPAVADAIAGGRVPDLDEDARAVYDFAAGLLADGTVDDRTFDAVVARWGHRGAMDLIGAVGYYCLVSFILNVDRYPLPDGAPPLPPL